MRADLKDEFAELRGIAVDNLLYVKEDVILPHHVTFYELISKKAWGKTGPLWRFDEHSDVRLHQDSRVITQESHPGKVCERIWYEKNKFDFPASGWVFYDPKTSDHRDKKAEEVWVAPDENARTWNAMACGGLASDTSGGVN
eukprot:TRINITY_DN23966_c0_g1_i2.p1 TRINITY_DN23966_c0_g1~~TRINITY_DN23966_c0_g1_i2.p1  ORF type:complete len:142 (-),score=17.49 TRINITY_DN23966_c0_g1_i2:185-610(-)